MTTILTKTQSRTGKRATGDDGPFAADRSYPRVYTRRVAARVAAWHSAVSSDGPVDGAEVLFLLPPPGIDCQDLCLDLVGELAIAAKIGVCGDVDLDELSSAAADAGALLVLLYPERLPAGEFDSLLASLVQTPSARCIMCGHWPVGPARRQVRDMGVQRVGARELCFTREEFSILLEAFGDPADPCQLFELTQGWPLISQLAICEVHRDGVPQPQSFSLAKLKRVPGCFAGDWLPQLRARYPWLPAVNRLPLVNLDVLGFLFDDPFAQVQECLALGWLEPCQKNSGFYQLNSAVAVLLLSTTVKEESHDVLERAAQWYRQQGFPAEALECLVSFVESDQLSEILDDTQRLKSPPAGSSQKASPLATSGDAMRSASAVARGYLASASSQTKANWTRAILGKLVSREGVDAGSSPCGAAPVDVGDRAASDDISVAEGRVSAILDHIAVAFTHHRGQNAEAVSSALARAVEAGIDRQSLSEVLDFVDLHIRPLLRNEGSPLQLALRDLKHSAPAREVVAAQYKQLNHRELQILQRVCEGYKNREISEQLGLELSTIKWYATGIYEKLQVRNRTQAVAKAQALKLFG